MIWCRWSQIPWYHTTGEAKLDIVIVLERSRYNRIVGNNYFKLYWFYLEIMRLWINCRMLLYIQRFSTLEITGTMSPWHFSKPTATTHQAEGGSDGGICKTSRKWLLKGGDGEGRDWDCGDVFERLAGKRRCRPILVNNEQANRLCWQSKSSNSYIALEPAVGLNMESIRTMINSWTLGETNKYWLTIRILWKRSPFMTILEFCKF